jgi:chromosome segregation ATPase
MEMDQIHKQVNWLDEERRKDGAKIASLEERIQQMEKSIATLTNTNKELNSEVVRLSALITRMDNLDENFLQMQIKNQDQFESLEKQFQKMLDENSNFMRSEIRTLERAMADINKTTDQIPEIKRNLTTRVEEEKRLSSTMDNLREQINIMRKHEDEYHRTIKMMEDSKRQDTKRLTDLIGEVNSLRKRMDEQRGNLELASASIRKLENRLNEFLAIETERREEVTTFINNQAIRDAERERVWKEWQNRFRSIESQASDIENTLQSLDNTHRIVKQSQKTIDELIEKVERRINEITEMQRLEDERFRQDWVTFKADDQKRWTNYTLTTDERQNDTLRKHERLTDQVTDIEDEMQEIQDILTQLKEHTEKRMQSLLALNHEWISSFERTIGRSRNLE